MDIVIGYTADAPNKIDKEFTNQFTVSGTLRKSTSIVNPSIDIEIADLSQANYVYIPLFHRYYYITNITVTVNGLWQVDLSVDVLKSFAPFIKNLSVILSDSTVTGANDYLNGDIWINKVKQFTDIINFPNGLLENGEYILITAGG